MVVSLTDDEAPLTRAAASGDLDAFNTLIARYQEAAFRIAYRMIGDRDSAADLVQEAVITAWRSVRQLRGERFRPWLMRIVSNRATDELRRRKRRPVLSLTAADPEAPDDELPIPDGSALPEEAAETAELNAAVQRCIERLSPDQRVVLVLCDVDGLDYQAIADTVRAQIGTVKSRLSRARASVRDCLQGVRELLPAPFRLIDQDDERDS